jgi:protein TonB
MVAAFVFNGSILSALILIPLIYPEALPRQMLNILLEAPVPPAPPRPVQQVAARPTHEVPEMQDGLIFAPPRIPIAIRMINSPEAPGGNTVVGAADLGQGGENPGAIFQGRGQAPVVRRESSKPVRLPSTIVAGMLVQKTIPVYPMIARETRTEGVVVLQAMISKSGTIEKLRVESGHPMLQQAALDAVSNWRYRPFLLNGQPVEVETTINVIFTLGH